MEWVETTAKSLDQAKELALDELGVAADDAEFEVLEEPRTGLFGRVRGEARVRARVKPATVRPKQDRRNRKRPDGKGAERPGDGTDAATVGDSAGPPRHRRSSRERASRASDRPATARAPADVDDTPPAGRAGTKAQGDTMSNDGDDRFDIDGDGVVVDVDQVRAAAEQFATGLVDAFGLEGTTSATVDGNEIEVRIDAQGDGLGLLIGPGGRTLLAIQDLARVAAQRRLGDHETRLRIDVAGYREKRRVALERFAQNVAELVKESGTARSLDPMPSADRKVIHDTLTDIEGVVSRSEGEDPNRRIIVSPA